MKKLGTLQKKALLSLIESNDNQFQSWLEKGLYAYYIKKDHKNPFINTLSTSREQLLNHYICDHSFILGAIEGLKNSHNQLDIIGDHREIFKSTVVNLFKKYINESSFNDNPQFLIHILELGEMINAMNMLDTIHLHRSKIILKPELLDAALNFMISSFRSCNKNQLNEFIFTEINNITLMKEFPSKHITRAYLALSEMHPEQYATFLEKNNDRFLLLKKDWSEKEWTEHYLPMLAKRFCSILSIKEIAQNIVNLTISNSSLAILTQKQLSTKGSSEQSVLDDTSWFIDALFSGENPNLRVIEKNEELHIAFSMQPERSEFIDSDNQRLFSYLKQLRRVNNSSLLKKIFKELPNKISVFLNLNQPVQPTRFPPNIAAGN